jgi:hypothetical protein
MVEVQDHKEGPSQAALAIAQLRVCRWSLHRMINQARLDPSALLGLELDAVLLGDDPAPTPPEETRRQRLRREEHERQAAAKKAQRLRDEDHRRTMQKRREAQEELRRQRDAQKAEARSQREEALAKRWADQALDRKLFADRFAEDFLREMHATGWAFDLCSSCTQPYWILYDNLVDWSLYWKGTPRCLCCYCPPLADRVRRENPHWSAGRVQHEIVRAIHGSGSYAWSSELVRYGSTVFASLPPRSA